MNRSRTLIFAGIIALILIVSSCEKVVFTEPEIIPPDTTVVISYSKEIQPIWDDKCVNCHGGQRDPDLRPAFSYNELITGGYIDTTDAANSELMKKLYGSHDERATTAQKLLIQEWMKQGAKNN
jgi:hypothetical protein